MEKVMKFEEKYRNNSDVNGVLYKESARIIAMCLAFGGDNIQKILNDYAAIVANSDEKERMIKIRTAGDRFA